MDTLYRCDDNQWCCSLGGNVTSCCQDSSTGRNLFRLPQTPAQIQNSTALAPGLTIARTEQLQSPAPNSTVKIGVGIGVGILFPLLAVLIGALFQLSRVKRDRARLEKAVSDIYAARDRASSGYGGSPSAAHGFAPRELEGFKNTQELEVPNLSRELPG